jgi:hypothetical protein
MEKDSISSLEVRSGNAQVVVANQGETQSIIDYMSIAETTKVRSRIQET